MNASTTTVAARRGVLGRVRTGAATLLDAGHGTVRVPLRGQRVLPGDEPGVSYRRGPFLVTAIAATDGAVYLTLQDSREPECMPLAWESLTDLDDAARILAVLLGAVLSPASMWPALNLVAGVRADRANGLPDDERGAHVIAAWTDAVPTVVAAIAGATGTPLIPGRVGRYVRAQQIAPVVEEDLPGWPA